MNLPANSLAALGRIPGRMQQTRPLKWLRRGGEAKVTSQEFPVNWVALRIRAGYSEFVRTASQSIYLFSPASGFGSVETAHLFFAPCSQAFQTGMTSAQAF